MDTILYRRLERLERYFQLAQAAPTFPIYDTTNMPEDAVDAQIVIGLDDSINWFDGTSWQTQTASDIVVGDIPQDALEGQIVIGSDCSLCWFSNGTWHGVAGSLATGNPPQDAVEGQLVVSNNGLAWYCNEQWYGFTIV